jgi:endonuclease/exonuclease/phosphatase family metal-dependent hydrolase
MYTHADYPTAVAEDIVRLRRCLTGIPAKETDRNLLVATWNVRAFGGLYEPWTENPGSPKRNRRGLAVIAEVVRHFDVVAVQEVKRETEAIRALMRDFLGPDWGVLMSDVTEGDKGNAERLAYLYDRRRVTPSGLAGEIVIPPLDGEPAPEQFDRTPYIVGFRAGPVQVALLTAHIRYGSVPADRRPELERFARHTARYLRDRAVAEAAEEKNLVVLGDFNIDQRKLDDPLFAAFVSRGLVVPPELLDVKSSTGRTPKHYDQIAWFTGALDLPYRSHAGVVDFTDAVFPELTRSQMTYRVSDHFPMWVEFGIDRTVAGLADVLGVEADPRLLDAAVP